MLQKQHFFSQFDYQIRCRNSDVSTFLKYWSILKENHRSEIWNMIVKGQISNQTIYVYECAILIIWSCRAVDGRLRCIFSKAKYYIFTRGLSVGLYLLCNNSIVQLQKWNEPPSIFQIHGTFFCTYVQFKINFVIWYFFFNSRHTIFRF